MLEGTRGKIFLNILKKHLNIVKCEKKYLGSKLYIDYVTVVILSVLANSGSPQNHFPGDE